MGHCLGGGRVTAWAVVCPLSCHAPCRLSIDGSSNWVEVTWRKSFLGTSYVVCVELTQVVSVAEMLQQLRGRVWEESKTADMSEWVGRRGVTAS